MLPVTGIKTDDGGIFMFGVVLEIITCFFFFILPFTLITPLRVRFFRDVTVADVVDSVDGALYTSFSHSLSFFLLPFLVTGRAHILKKLITELKECGLPTGWAHVGEDWILDVAGFSVRRCVIDVNHRVDLLWKKKNNLWL